MVVDEEQRCRILSSSSYIVSKLGKGWCQVASGSLVAQKLGPLSSVHCYRGLLSDL